MSYFNTVNNEQQPDKASAEFTAFYILSALCALPAVMSVVDLIAAMFMDFSTVHTRQGYIASKSFYAVTNKIYLVLFLVIGTVCFLFSLHCIMQNRSWVFSKKNFKQKPWIVLLLMMLLWTGICTLTSDNILIALTGYDGTHQYFSGFLSIIIYASVCACSMIISSENYRLRLIRIFCFVITILSVLILVQVFTDDFLVSIYSMDLASVFFQHNHFGYVSCMGIIGVISLYLFDRQNASPYYRFNLLVGEVIMLLALLYNDTFGSYLAIMVTLPVMYFIHSKRSSGTHFADFLPVLAFILITAVNSFGLIPGTLSIWEKLIKLVNDFAALITGARTSNKVGTGRGYLWKETIRRTKLRPIFGYGPYGFSGNNPLMNGTYIDAPHNEFLQRAAYTGIPGLILYLTMLSTLMFHNLKNIKKLAPMVAASCAVTTVYLVSSTFGNPVFYTAPYLYMFLGLSSATNEDVTPAIQAETYQLNSILRQFINTFRNYRKSIMMLSLILLTFILIIFRYINMYVETNDEMSDIASMRLAENMALNEHMKGHLKRETDYWFEMDTTEFIEVSERDPVSRGLGKKTVGNGCENYKKQFGFDQFKYDESVDYTDKAIQLRIVYVDGKPTVNLEWIHVPYVAEADSENN